VARKVIPATNRVRAKTAKMPIKVRYMNVRRARRRSPSRA
jgi:hypothetical protein